MINHVLVGVYALEINTIQASKAMLEQIDNGHGGSLLQALTLVDEGHATYAVPQGQTATAGTFRLDMSGSLDVPRISSSDPLAELEAASYVTSHHLMLQKSNDTYLTIGRSITAVQVVKPFSIVEVCYRSSVPQDGESTSARPLPDQWEIGEQSDVVPAGWYVVAEIDDRDHMPDLIAVAGVNDVPDDVAAWLHGLDGVGVTTCRALCDGCGDSWVADSGGWMFRPDGDTGDIWHFQDVRGFYENAIDCPSCFKGWVRFTVS